MSPETPRDQPQSPDLQDLRGRLLITFGEAAPLCGVSERTLRRWGAEYIASGGTRGLPVIQVTEKRRLVVVAKLLARFGLEDSARRPGPPTLGSGTRS